MLRFVTEKEREHYEELNKRLKNPEGKLDASDTNAIIHHMNANRQRYQGYISYSDIAKDTLASFFGPLKPLVMTLICSKIKVPKCCKKEYERDGNNTIIDKDAKAEQRYNHGKNRYLEEMDVVKMLKAIRISKMLFKAVLKPEERLLL